METLLVFLAIAAIQMLAAYSKQKKAAAKKANAPIPEPFREEEEEPEFEFEQKYEFEPKPVLERELKHDIKPTHAAHHVSPAPHHAPAAHPVSYAATPLKEGKKDPAQGIIWTAILSEPRYKVKWKPLAQ